MYEAYREQFRSIKAAKKHIESLPYWAEAISKDGFIQTVFDTDGYPVCSRQLVVEGIGSNKTVSVGSWYDY